MRFELPDDFSRCRVQVRAGRAIHPMHENMIPFDIDGEGSGRECNAVCQQQAPQIRFQPCFHFHNGRTNGQKEGESTRRAMSTFARSKANENTPR